MISIIDCSPKLKSNSSYFIRKISKRLDDCYKTFKLYSNNIDLLIENISKTNTIIFVFPLYVDAPPSKLISLMEKYNDFKYKKIYVISNCGFLEPKHNDSATKIIENWCLNNKGIFMGSLKIGAGEVIGNNKNFLLSPLFNIKIKKFAKRINQKRKVNLSCSICLTKKMFCYFANKGFKNKIHKI